MGISTRAADLYTGACGGNSETKTDAGAHPASVAGGCSCRATGLDASPATESFYNRFHRGACTYTVSEDLRRDVGAAGRGVSDSGSPKGART